MVLSETERDGCRDILGKLSEDDLKSLARTVTKNQDWAGTKADAVDAILTYSESAAGLLGRQKIWKEILVQYLKEKKVPFSVKWHKTEIVYKILEFWKLTSDAAHKDTEIEEKISESVKNISIQETESISDSKQHKDTEIEEKILEGVKNISIQQTKSVSDSKQPEDTEAIQKTESISDSKQPEDTEAIQKTESISDSKQPEDTEAIQKTESISDSKQPEDTEAIQKTESISDSKQHKDTEIEEKSLEAIAETESVSDPKQDFPRRGRSRDAK